MSNDKSASLRHLRVGIREWLISVGVQGLDDQTHPNYIKLSAELDMYVAQKTKNMREQMKQLTSTRQEQNKIRKQKYAQKRAS